MNLLYICGDRVGARLVGQFKGQKCDYTIQRCIAVNETTKPISTDAPKTNSPPTVRTSPQARVTDDEDQPRGIFQENRNERWNEHEYYIRARSDLQKHHHEKITKVIIPSKLPTRS